MQSQIVNFWQQKERLPEDLDELRDSISGFVPPRDPQTGDAYSYRTQGDLSFELCATFNLSSKDSQVISRQPAISPLEKTGIEENWEYTSGYTCFERTIDPERYKIDVRIPSNLP